MQAIVIALLSWCILRCMNVSIASFYPSSLFVPTFHETMDYLEHIYAHLVTMHMEFARSNSGGLIQHCRQQRRGGCKRRLTLLSCLLLATMTTNRSTVGVVSPQNPRTSRAKVSVDSTWTNLSTQNSLSHLRGKSENLSVYYRGFHSLSLSF